MNQEKEKMSKNLHAVSLGKKGGQSKSEAKRKSSKENLIKARAARKAKNESVSI